MYAFIWLHLITPACFWKLEFPSNCSGAGEDAAGRLQAFLLQKLLGVLAATFKSPDDLPRVALWELSFVDERAERYLVQPGPPGKEGNLRSQPEPCAFRATAAV